MSLEQRVTDIPGNDGWWKSHSEETYLKYAQLLVSKGFSEDDTIDMLTSLYYSAADCFGG